MKVWIYRYDFVSLDDGNDSEIRAFDSYEKAKAHYDSIVNEERGTCKNDGLEIEEDDNSFEAWEDGYYNDNHVTHSITELEVF